MDDEEIEAGEKFGERLLKAIKESRYYVVILSEGYADSKWCLRELEAMVVHMMESAAMSPQYKKEIIPIFYYVEPSDVRHQRNTFENAFKKHEVLYDPADVMEWRQAMTAVGERQGFHLNKNKKEAEWIQEIVKSVGGCSDNVMLPVADHPVGIDSRVEEVMKFLSIEEEGVKMVGIYGMGGIGKTTLVKEIHNRLKGRFEKAIYIEAIKDKKDRLPELQEELISKVFKNRNKKICNRSEGEAEIKRRFPHKRVLAVLDDVDHWDQLKALAGHSDWFGEGTRILITTRDVQLLNVHRHVAKKYQVHELDERESLHLFSHHAFNSDQPSEEFMEISTKIAKAAGGLPLALEVLGASLSTETEKEAWEEVETKLRSSGYSKIDNCLRISFDGLNRNDQEGFLDIACFFIGEDKDEVIDIWKGCDFDAPVSTVNSLLHKCLVKVGFEGTLYMHDLLRDMGRDIGSCSRMWDQKKVWGMLEEHKVQESKFLLQIYSHTHIFSQLMQTISVHDRLHQGTDQIKGIICEGYLEEEQEGFDAVHSLVPPEQERKSVDVEAFANMPNLQLLLLKNVYLKGDFSRMPRSSRSLKWTSWRMQTPPDNFNIQKLGCLKLDYNNIVQFWSDSCTSKKKVFTNLKVLDLSGCSKLRKLPDFSHSLDLEKLRLQGCSSLTDIPESIGNSTKLKMIDLRYCDALQSLPSSIERLSKLEHLVLHTCSSLSRLSGSINKLTGLRKLEVSYCGSLLALPNSIGNFTRLEELSLRSWASFSTLPHFLENLTRLRSLDVSHCECLSALPDSIENLSELQELRLSYCKSLSTLPNCIGQLTRLKRLMLDYCTSLSALPDSIGNLTELEELPLTNCTSLPTLPDSFGNLTRLRRLAVRPCELSALPNSIGNLIGLEYLILSSCKSLSTLPNSIGNLTGLRELIVSGCDSLLALPNSIGSLTRLVDISVSSARLSMLPPSIGNLTRLRSLRVSCECLLALPNSIGSLTGLQILELVKCQSLSMLPDLIENLTGLKKLDLSHCTSLKALPDYIGNLTALESLQLSHCTSLKAFPDSIGNLTELKKLDLSHCTSLKELPDSIGNLTALKSLQLSHCTSIKALPDSIRNLSRLEYLRFDSCISLSTLPDSIVDLTALKELGAAGCTSLLALPDSIGNLTGLKLLRLASCTNLSTLPSSIGSMRRLSTLVLSGSGIEELPDSVRLLEFLKWLGIANCRLRSRLRLCNTKCLRYLVIGGENIDLDEIGNDDGDENELWETDGIGDNNDGGRMEVCEIADGIARVGGEVNQKDESDSDDVNPMEVCEIPDGITHVGGEVNQKDEIDGDNGDQNNELFEIPDGITHYSQHTQECRRIRYIDSWDEPLNGRLYKVFELSIWVVSGRERKIILYVYSGKERSCKCPEGREYWNGSWLKHIFPDDFTPLHDAEALEACASSSSAPDLSQDQLKKFHDSIVRLAKGRLHQRMMDIGLESEIVVSLTTWYYFLN